MISKRKINEIDNDVTAENKKQKVFAPNRLASLVKPFFFLTKVNGIDNDKWNNNQFAISLKGK